MYCSQCGSVMPPQTVVCGSCGFQNAPVTSGTSIGDDPAMRVLLPVGQSPHAIAAGYLGLFSLLCFPAPFAILFGVLALRDIKRNPSRHGRGRAIFGLVMGVAVLIGYPALVFAISLI